MEEYSIRIGKIIEWIHDDYPEKIYFSDSEWFYISTEIDLPVTVMLKFKDKIKWEYYFRHNSGITLDKIIAFKEILRDWLMFFNLTRHTLFPVFNKDDQLMFLFYREITPDRVICSIITQTFVLL